MSNLIPTEHKNQRVLTTQQLAELYETEPQIITNNFARNDSRYTPGLHYYRITGGDLRELKATNQIDVSPNVNVLYVWTEKGALLHAKSLNTDKAVSTVG